MPSLAFRCFSPRLLSRILRDRGTVVRIRMFLDASVVQMLGFVAQLLRLRISCPNSGLRRCACKSYGRHRERQ